MTLAGHFKRAKWMRIKWQAYLILTRRHMASDVHWSRDSHFWLDHPAICTLIHFFQFLHLFEGLGATASGRMSIGMAVSVTRLVSIDRRRGAVELEFSYTMILCRSYKCSFRQVH